MTRLRTNKETQARLLQLIGERDVARPAAAAQEPKWKPLDDEIHRLVQQPGAASTLRMQISRRGIPTPMGSQVRTIAQNARRLRTALIEQWGEDKWEDKTVAPSKPGETTGKGPADKHVAFEDNGNDSSHTLDHMDNEQYDALMSPVKPAPKTHVSKQAKPTGLLMKCGTPQLASARRELERAAEPARETHPAFGTPGVMNPRLSYYSTVAIAQRARETRAELQAKELLQHGPTTKALEIILREYPGEDAAAHGERLKLARHYLRHRKEELERNQATLKAMSAEPMEITRLTPSEVLSVQQMYRAIHRPPGTQLHSPMREAVRDFLEQFSEGARMPQTSLAQRFGMLPAIVNAVRTANDAELENDKKLAAAAQAASEKLDQESKQTEPTTPTHQTGSGSVPPTPAAPKKKAATKKATSAKPTGVQKPATTKKLTPAKSTKTETPTRRSTRIREKQE